MLVETRKHSRIIRVAILAASAFASATAGRTHLLSPPAAAARRAFLAESSGGKQPRHRLSEAQIVLCAQRYMAEPSRWHRDLFFHSIYDTDKSEWSVVVQQVAPPDKEGRLGLSQWSVLFTYDIYGDLLDVFHGY